MRTRPNNYKGAQFSDMDLSGSDFSKANLSGADLRGSTLMGADLRGTSLHGAHIDDADFFCASRHEHDHPVFGWIVIYGLMFPDYRLRSNGRYGESGYTQKTEIELANLYHQGDEKAIAALLERKVVEDISKYAAKKIKGSSGVYDELRQDARQEIAIKWLQVIKSEDEFRAIKDKSNDQFRAWLRTVANNAVVSFIRRRLAIDNNMFLDDVIFTPNEDSDATSMMEKRQEAVVAEQYAQDMAQTYSALSQITAEAFVRLQENKPDFAAVLLAEMRGDTDEEIANDMGIAETTVRTRKTRAREFLQQYAEQLQRAATARSFREALPQRGRVEPIRRRVL